MKVFRDNKDAYWGDKVNFVDENNVFVGYDMGQSCCEHADWFIADEITKGLKGEQPDSLDGWNFDTNFFQKIDYIEGGDEKHYFNELYEGIMVVFRITKDDKEKFLHLFNCHNGYYGHGFEMKIGGETKREGCL